MKAETRTLSTQSYKALSKQEGPTVCWGMLVFYSFFEFQSAACCKKGFKKQASQQMLDHSYFVRALVETNSRSNSSNYCLSLTQDSNLSQMSQFIL